MNSRDYELLVREIYQQMVDQDRASNIVVQHDVQMQGRMTSHQIDVFWEFRLAGVAHRVIVQVKKWKGPIRKGEVLTFKSVIDDLPGTIGIMVTQSHYQKGAIEVAKASGIMICSLEEETRAPFSVYPGETLQLIQRGSLMAPDGSFLGFLIDVAQKIPELSEMSFKADSKWHELHDPLPQTMTIKLPQPIQFYDEEGNASLTLARVLGDFYAEMHRDGQMEAHKVRKFEEPTFVKLLDSSRVIKEESFSVKIVFRPKVTEVVAKTSNVAIFVLKSLIDGAEHRVLLKAPSQPGHAPNKKP